MNEETRIDAIREVLGTYAGYSVGWNHNEDEEAKTLRRGIDALLQLGVAQYEVDRAREGGAA